METEARAVVRASFFMHIFIYLCWAKMPMLYIITTLCKAGTGKGASKLLIKLNK